MKSTLLKELHLQEEQLQFESFNSADAWAIGQILVNKGSIGNNITIDITKNRQQLFHYSFDKTSVDNDEWVRRKTNMVYRFGHSSYAMVIELENMGRTLDECFHISEVDHAVAGGCFPIIIKNTGVIGTITVSGLTQEEDHALVVEAIKEHLAV